MIDAVVAANQDKDRKPILDGTRPRPILIALVLFLALVAWSIFPAIVSLIRSEARSILGLPPRDID